MTTTIEKTIQNENTLGAIKYTEVPHESKDKTVQTSGKAESEKDTSKTVKKEFVKKDSTKSEPKNGAVEIVVPSKTAIAQMKKLDVETSRIRKEVENITNSFYRIGYVLWHVKEKELFSARGHRDIYEYADKELGFKKSSTANYISICEKFCKRDDKDKPLPQLQDEFSKLSYGQLSESLCIPCEELSKVTPQMTVKEIRKLKKALKAAAEPVKEDDDENDDDEPQMCFELFNRTLTASNLETLIKQLREHIGEDIQVVVG